MKKIPTIFVRNHENMRKILNEQHHDCEWVFSGEGVARRKYDGTCCKVENGTLFKQREVKPGQKNSYGFVEEQLDLNTGNRVGWRPPPNINRISTTVKLSMDRKMEPINCLGQRYRKTRKELADIFWLPMQKRRFSKTALVIWMDGLKKWL